MSSSNYQKILSSFSLLSYSPTSLISKQKLHLALSHLNNSQYLYDITQQLWDQLPTNQYREGVISDIAQVIVKAQNVLVIKIKELENDVRELERELEREMEGIKGSGRKKVEMIERIREEIQELRWDKENYEEDLVLLTRPFNIFINLRQIETNYRYKTIQQLYPNQIFSQQLRLILWLILLIFILHLLCSFIKPQFPNLLFTLALLSLFLFGLLDPKHLKLSLWLVLISIILDFFWLMFWAAGYWSVGISDVAVEGGLYLKGIVIGTVVGVVLKIVVGILMLGLGKLEEGTVYVVMIGMGVKLKIVVKREKKEEEEIQEKREIEDRHGRRGEFVR